MCTISVWLPEQAGENIEAKFYIALYLAARHTMDYRLAAALHIYSVKSKIAVHPGLLSLVSRDAKVESKLPLRYDEECSWEVVLYRGILYAESILDMDRRVIVKIEPPRDKRGREKLRTLLEGKRVTVKGKTYHTRGLIQRLGGERLAPWIYLMPKRSIKALYSNLETRVKLTIYTP
ncbi:MAG: hypothetical protein QXQ57_02590 [Sulfolobales archaeon]